MSSVHLFGGEPTLVGISAVYLGGWYDAVVSRLLDFLFDFPQLVLMIALGIIVPGGLLPAPVQAVFERADRRREQVED